MQDYHELDVWKKAHPFVLDVYKATMQFPDAEKYGLVSQMRRAAVSIPGNIAEGCGRETNAELARFLYISLGSARELEYYLLLARDLHYLDQPNYTQLAAALSEIQKMLSGLIKKVQGPNHPKR